MAAAADKIISLSQVRLPTERQLREFEPTEAHLAIAGVLNNPETSSSSFTELASHAGVSLRTLQRALSDPAALQWMVAQATRVAEARLGAVHSRLLSIALTGKPAQALAAIRMYLERFDPAMKQQRVLEKGHNTFNFDSMSEAELNAIVERFQRRFLGSAGSHPGSDGPPRGLLGPSQPEGDLPAGNFEASDAKFPHRVSEHRPGPPTE